MFRRQSCRPRSSIKFDCGSLNGTASKPHLAFSSRTLSAWLNTKLPAGMLRRLACWYGSRIANACFSSRDTSKLRRFYGAENNDHHPEHIDRFGNGSGWRPSVVGIPGRDLVLSRKDKLSYKEDFHALVACLGHATSPNFPARWMLVGLHCCVFRTASRGKHCIRLFFTSSDAHENVTTSIDSQIARYTHCESTATPSRIFGGTHFLHHVKCTPDSRVGQVIVIRG